MNEQILFNRPTFPAQLDMAHPLTKGLVGCWVLNDPSGMRAWDSSPQQHHLIATGTRNTAQGKLFSGVDEDCRITNPKFQDNLQGALEYWISYNTISGTPVSFSTAGGTDDEFQFTHTGSNPDLSFILNTIASAEFRGNTTLEVRRYYQIIWSSNASVIRLYVNGLPDVVTVLVGSNAGQWFNAVTDGNTFTLGGVVRAALVADFPCMIALVRVWNQPITARQAQELYLNPYEMFLT